ncbi:osmotically inducible protein C [Corynebacterium falsenii DSM 44353]|uniref:alpha/beta hydrolase family protein n=1 Tax=Corynebacterium falsenii TaxID=108486 RepID=UPI0003E94297|nr:alpha/beta hydrolase [Corynebacterium falsenii]AHI03053.1 osmotically inducible protein C [Corynebacterium falsenii DSM 44353]UBI03766.1 alpha/beta hydrolase [Corynebacterium falsenii]
MSHGDNTASGGPDGRSVRPVSVKSVQVKIPTERGITLAGTLDLPGWVSASERRNLPTAVVAHCFTCNKSSPGVSRISKTLARHGMASLRIDFAGLGKSEGEFARSSLDTNVADVVAAADWLAEQGSSPLLLVGHSLGGAAVLRAGSLVDSVRAVATVGVPYDPRYAAATIPDVVRELSDNDLEEAGLASRPIKIGVELLQSLAAYDPAEVLRKLGSVEDRRTDGSGVSLLFVHSPLDRTVPFRNALQLIETADQPASLIAVPEVDHLLTWKGAGTRVGELIATWAEPLVQKG